MPENLGLEVVPPPRPFRFGPFELDARAGELRKHGVRIRLKQQSIQVLLMLLKPPGEVVLREEIRERLWPEDTVVEFDHSINAAIQNLRDALGESAANPRYIETLPRRGYRFMGAIETPGPESVFHPQPVPRTASSPTPETATSATEQAEPARSPHRDRLWAGRLALTAAGLLVVLIALAAWLGLPALRPVGNWTLSLGAIGGARVSPDGSSVIYATSRGLLLRRMDSLQETPLYVEERFTDLPVWSPDGSHILFNTLRGLISLPLSGPPTVIVPQIGITRGYSWAPDGTVIASVLARPNGGELNLLTAKGGNPTRLEVPDWPRGQFFYPEFLPDGKNILFAWNPASDEAMGLYLATLENGKIVRGPILLRRNLTAGHYSPAGGGKLFYVQSDRLYAQTLNVRRGTLEGEAEQVVDGVFSEVALHRADFSVSRNGVLVWRAGRAGLAQLTWFDRTGRVLGTAGPACVPSFVRLSRDEKHVLVVSVTDVAGYSIVATDKSGYTGLPGLPMAPVWMPDSSHIMYGRKEGSTYRVVERAAEGGVEKELVRLPALNQLSEVSSDGKALLYRAGQILYSVRLDGPAEGVQPRIVAQINQGRLSPDGRWVVYMKPLGNSLEVYVQPFPSGGLPTQITSNGGSGPIWRGDGKEILYRNGSTIYAVRVEVNGNAIHAGPPEALFDVRVPAGLTGDSIPMAVTRDGSKILFAQGVEQPNPQLTYIMTAWDRALRR